MNTEDIDVQKAKERGKPIAEAGAIELAVEVGMALNRELCAKLRRRKRRPLIVYHGAVGRG